MRILRAVGVVAVTITLGAGALVGTTSTASAGADGSGSSAARIAGGYAQTVFVAADGTPYAVGSGTHGELTGGFDRSTLTAMAGLPAGVTADGVAAAGYFTLVLGSDGVVYVTGDSQSGGLTPDTGLQTLTAVPGLPGGVRATGVAAGNFHAVVLGSDGKVYGIGDNAKGQLTGMETTVSSLTVMTGLPGGVTATRVGAGYYETYVIGSDGNVYGAGRNENGELTGSGQVSTLTKLSGLPEEVTATGVAGGRGHSLVAGSDGQVYGTGYNAHGQLTGSGSKSSLTKVTGLPEGVTATSVAAGDQHSLVLGSDGVAYGTGLNESAQLTGATSDKTSLTSLTGLPVGISATAVAAGDFGSLVLGSDGVLYGAGANGYHQVTDLSDETVATLSALSAQPLASTAPPTISGTPVVGNVLTAMGGTWMPAPTGHTYEWRAGEAVVGAGTTYAVRAADAGKTITVTETAVRDGFATGQATSVATPTVPPAVVPPVVVPPVVVPPVVKATSKTKVVYAGASKIKAGKKGGKVQVTVTAAPAVAVTGEVSIVDTVKTKGKKAKTRTLATRTLVSSQKGKVTVVLAKLAKGKHTLVVRYLGSATVKASAGPKQVFTVR